MQDAEQKFTKEELLSQEREKRVLEEQKEIRLKAQQQLADLNRKVIKAGLNTQDKSLINKRVRHQEFMLKRYQRQSSQK